MIWIKREAGEYESRDERFHIIHTWDRINGLHWNLWDRASNRNYTCDSLKHCKYIADNVMK